MEIGCVHKLETENRFKRKPAPIAGAGDLSLSETETGEGGRGAGAGVIELALEGGAFTVRERRRIDSRDLDRTCDRTCDLGEAGDLQPVQAGELVRRLAEGGKPLGPETLALGQLPDRVRQLTDEVFQRSTVRRLKVGFDLRGGRGADAGRDLRRETLKGGTL